MLCLKYTRIYLRFTMHSNGISLIASEACLKSAFSKALVSQSIARYVRPMAFDIM